MLEESQGDPVAGADVLAWQGKAVRRWPRTLELKNPGSYVDMSVSMDP